MSVALLALLFLAARDAFPLRQVADAPLPGDASRFDYASVDAGRRRLFVAHLGASEVLAIDLDTNAMAGRVGDLRSVHGVLAIPALARFYATATGSDEVVAIDAGTLEERGRMRVGAYPDGLAFAAAARKLYVSNKNGKSVSVLEVPDDRVVATIEIGGTVGNTQVDPASGRVFANDQTHRQLVEIDPATDTIAGRIDLPGAEGDHGLLIVPKPRLAFVACEDNDRLLVVDLERRAVVARFDTAHEPDVLALDAKASRVFVASESGDVDAFGIRGSAVVALGRSLVGPGAHVVAIDPSTSRAYFPLANVGGKPVLRVMERTDR